ncbi:alpha/beta hydrolase domain-containing protein [Sphingobium sp. H39-3-25]|uniref:alpha/beta hydrolase domain-containing protein n=1 Tax=Sphingobium arseniciresistens TaxID=3030834 RepID=UPI0023B973F0|nr:alpha/beta hydrolase domain-containing protein [Sphingobium arseniciresistens]
MTKNTATTAKAKFGRLASKPSGLLLVLLAGAASLGIPGAASGEPKPVTASRTAGTAVGPVTFTLPPKNSGKPFGATSMDLAAHGYVEEEFLVNGLGNRYRMKGPLATAELVDGGHPFTSRILVRRPTDPKKFNGIVLLEWFNVSGGQDIDFLYAAIRKHLIDQGYAWVGVSAQAVGANTLKVANPARYGSISVAASNEDPNGGILDRPTGPPGPDSPSDVLSWDIFTQVGAALRQPATAGAPSPLGNLRPKMVLASGESQSAFRLTDYYNAIQPLYPDVFDAFFTYDRVMRPQRTDVKARHLSIGTEAFASPPPDNDNLRLWELAGASHVSANEVSPYLDEQVFRSGLLLYEGKPTTLTDNNLRACKVHPVLSLVPNGDALNAGLEALITWARGGPAPTMAARMARDKEGRLVRDAEGRVSGGIRLAAYDAPMSHSTGTNTGDWFCGIIGSHVDFTPAEMCRRYGSPRQYVHKVTQVSRKAQSDGFLLKADADLTIAQSRRQTFTCSQGGN